MRYVSLNLQGMRMKSWWMEQHWANYLLMTTMMLLWMPPHSLLLVRCGMAVAVAADDDDVDARV